MKEKYVKNRILWFGAEINKINNFRDEPMDE